MKELTFLAVGIVIGSLLTRQTMVSKNIERELDRERARRA